MFCMYIRCVQCAYLQLIQSVLVEIKSVEMSLFNTRSALVCLCVFLNGIKKATLVLYIPSDLIGLIQMETDF